MTGDGVNDAPSLVAADLGVSMGGIGTEVAKEASDIVLLDDNFGSIISAAEEGRSIYKNIKKVLLYLTSTGIGEALTIMAALFVGLPLPLLATQIIWLNLVTDSFLDVSLAMEPKEKNLMKEKFRRPSKYIFDKLMMWRMVIMTIPMVIGTLFLFEHYVGNYSMEKAWTISMTTLAVFQWLNALNCRSEKQSAFKNLLSNKFLIGAMFIVVSLQLLVVYNPFMQKVLRTESLTISEWGIITLIAISIIIVEETRKFFYRRSLKN